MRHRPLRPLPVRPDLRLQGRPGVLATTGSARSSRCGRSEMAAPARKPKLAVWKFSSCDGCQLSPARLRGRAARRRRRGRDRLLPRGVAAPRSRGPTTCRWSRARSPPPHDAERIQEVRRQSRALVTIGACATAGGIQALRNFADVDELHRRSSTRGRSTSARSPPRRRSPAHVKVDFELRGCPINKHQLLEVITAFLAGRKPTIAAAQRLHRVQAARAMSA